jgi:hypothetical protein
MGGWRVAAAGGKAPGTEDFDGRLYYCGTLKGSGNTERV